MYAVKLVLTTYKLITYTYNVIVYLDKFKYCKFSCFSSIIKDNAF